MQNYKYLQDTYLFNYQSKIIQIGEYNELKYLVLEDTIFYPQGGGQESDKGYIWQGDMKIKVTDVRKHNDQVLHFIDEIPNEIDLLKEVTIEIDKENRLLNARLHTAGHLLANILESIPTLIPTKGHQYQSGSYVECLGDITELNLKLEEIQKVIDQNINDDLKILTQSDLETNHRFVQIQNYSPVGCGGTHVKSLGEIGKLTINKIKNKKGKIRVSYSIS
ncbi:hypothetical protein CL656_00685 [bacterium]|nr:hypothetical protein [bacterium]|tara:strand:- start:4387 stop:5049 length:663 start_codon:yes stop_codon:yes gene_type:complete